MAVDDEEAAEAPLSGMVAEERPAHPGPVTILVQPGERWVPGQSEEGFELDFRVDARVDEQDVARAPACLQGFEPGAHAGRQRRARRLDQTVEILGRRV